MGVIKPGAVNDGGIYGIDLWGVTDEEARLMNSIIDKITNSESTTDEHEFEFVKIFSNERPLMNGILSQFSEIREIIKSIKDTEKILIDVSNHIEDLTAGKIISIKKKTRTLNKREIKLIEEKIGSLTKDEIKLMEAEMGVWSEDITKGIAYTIEKIEDLPEILTEEEIDSLREVKRTRFSIDSYNDMLAQTDEFIKSMHSHIESLTEDSKKKFSSLPEEIEEYKKTYYIHGVFLYFFKNKFLKKLYARAPNFILFKSFEDILPDKIPFDQLEKNEWIKDLSSISDLDIKTITGSDSAAKETHRDEINLTLNKGYQEFWKQDEAKLHVSWENPMLHFWIKEHGEFFSPSIRSKGKQWHLAFYIKVTARSEDTVPNIILFDEPGLFLHANYIKMTERSEDTVPNIILIDEPGMFLHAKAQKDILKKLESVSKKRQIIFSTHSPYLLQANKLDRIRLVHKTENEGTTITNQVHAAPKADKETLTPILTAIGLDMSLGISGVDKQNNVVVEGPSDAYYLQAFQILLKKDNKKDAVNFIAGGGAGNMPIVGTILLGWGARVAYLFDNDPGGQSGKRNLTKNWEGMEEFIMDLPISGSIEDMFTPDDFRKYVLPEDRNKNDSDSSKKKENNKVLLALLFLRKCREGSSVKLSAETMTNIKTLVDDIEQKFQETHKKLGN